MDFKDTILFVLRDFFKSLSSKEIINLVGGVEGVTNIFHEVFKNLDDDGKERIRRTILSPHCQKCANFFENC